MNDSLLLSHSKKVKNGFIKVKLVAFGALGCARRTL